MLNESSHTGVNLAEAFVEVLREFGIEDKILSITADNASNNDTMTDHMAELLTNFGGQCARTRCFLHITNLTAKSLLNEFDVKGKDALETADVDERELLALAKQLEDDLNDARHDAGEEVEPEDGDEEEDDDDDSWVDEVASLLPEEQEAFNEEVRPVKLVLLKVRSTSTWPRIKFTHTLDRFGVWLSK